MGEENVIQKNEDRKLFEKFQKMRYGSENSPTKGSTIWSRNWIMMHKMGVG
jgi:hypothetical protein